MRPNMVAPASLEALLEQLLADSGRRPAGALCAPARSKHSAAGFPCRQFFASAPVFVSAGLRLCCRRLMAALAGAPMSMVCSPTVACITDRKASHQRLR